MPRVATSSATTAAMAVLKGSLKMTIVVRGVDLGTLDWPKVVHWHRKMAQTAVVVVENRRQKSSPAATTMALVVVMGIDR